MRSGLGPPIPRRDEFIQRLISEGVLDATGGGRLVPAHWDTNGRCLVAPRSVFWEVTSRCNLGGCIHCYSSSDDEEPDFENHLDVMESLAALGVFTVDIGGGEPLLLPALPGIINAANRMGMRCNLATNLALDGQTVSDFVDAVDSWDDNSIQVSLDGPSSDLHDRIRQAPGAFVKTCENLRLLSARGIPFSFNCTVMPLNVDEVELIAATAADLGGASVRFVRLIPSGRGRDPQLHLTSEQYRDLCARLRGMSENLRDRIRVRTDDGFIFLAATAEERERMDHASRG